jgi:hypothetical protein
MALRMSARFQWRASVIGRQVKIAFVNRGALHVRREVVRVAEHPVGKLLVALVIPGSTMSFGQSLRARAVGIGV